MNHSSQVGAERAPSSRNASAAIQTEQLTPSELASHDAVTLGDTDVHSTHKEREQDGETAEQAAEADNEEEENGDDDDGADGDDDEGYAAEYRSLLFRVADLASQETQRARKQLFTLRMARREAQLLSRVVQQQQVYLATRASQKASTAVATATANSCDRTAALAEGAAPSAEPLTSSEAVAQVIMLGDARLSCMAYRAECAQQQWGQLVEAAAQLTTFARVTRHDNAYGATLRAKADEVAARLCDEAGVDFNSVTGNSGSANTTNSTTVVDERDEGFALPPSSATDAWLKHSSSLTTIGGTLAKVHTLFRDAACRASMAIVATHLTQLGRQSQQLLGELQLLMQHEAHMEAAFQRSCPYSMEWGLYAAHAQQAHEMADIYSPVTVAEMRAMALRKLLLRRRQELQNALTVVLLHDAEHSLHSSAGVSWANKSSLTVSSPAAEVTPEKLKAASDDCARWESLRDRLWRELLFLKKCARREFGVAWMAQLEAAAVSATATDAAAASVPSDDVRRLAATLRDNLRASTYDSVARVVQLAEQPVPAVRSSGGAEDSFGRHDRDNEEKEERTSGDQAQMPELSRSSPQSPLSPTAALPPRVRALALLESVQTRVHSLTSLLLENAKHRQRVADVAVEVECGSSPRDEAWSRTAELLLRRCDTNAAGEQTDSSSHGLEEAVAKDSGKEDSSSSGTNWQLSSLLEMEQQLLDVLNTSESRVLADLNSALAGLHARCTAPLQRVKRDVVLLVRLLQLCDETLFETDSNTLPQGSALCEADGTRSTPALESAVQLLSVAAGVSPSPSSSTSFREDKSPDALEALFLRLGSDAPAAASAGGLSCTVCLPQLPRDVCALQAAMAAVSTEWQQALRADTAALRSSVTAKQTDLEQYAQYSMADVPALLEAARGEVKALKAQLAGHAAQSARAAALLSQVETLREQIAQRTGSARNALVTAVQEARKEEAVLQAEVALLRARKAISEEEKRQREATCAAESAEWADLQAAAAAAAASHLDNATYDERVKAEGAEKADDGTKLENEDAEVQEEKDEEQQQPQHALSSTAARESSSPTMEQRLDEEASTQPEEASQEGRTNVFSDSLGALGFDHSQPLPLSPALPAPPTTTSTADAVLDENPFYSGFGFGDG